MALAQLNQILAERVTVIDHLNQRVIAYLRYTVDPIPIPILERLSGNYDERFYCGCLNNLDLVQKYLNASIQNLNQTVWFVDTKTGDRLDGIYGIGHLPLDLKEVETLVKQFLNQLDQTIQTFKHILDLNLGSEIVTNEKEALNG